jgi:elongator complex protein 3
VELGVQSLCDDGLDFNNRGHHINQTVKATKLLKNAGFKVSYQMMINLPGSDAKKDISMFQKLFSDPGFCPDHIKIYPLALVKEAAVYQLYLEKKYRPYDKEDLIKLLCEIKTKIPIYCRVERVIRDIPADYIVEGGAAISNLRQIVLNSMKETGLSCKCIRCREIKGIIHQNTRLFIEEYEASGEKEFFLSIESSDRKNIISMLRLRLNNNDNTQPISVLKNAALIREIHTYGPQIRIGKNEAAASQHKGFGKQLIKVAEEIAQKNGYNKMAVIAGVGVREYFRKLGYELKDTYMVKEL